MKRFFFGLALLLLLVACAPASRGVPVPAQPPQEPQAGKQTEQAKVTFTGVLPSMEERKIARTGNISLVVDDVLKSRDNVADLAARLGGYVVASNFIGGEHDFAGNISIRVPNERFDQALIELRALAVRVAAETVTSKDVTEEYVDLQSRLRNAEATEKQFLGLLSKANDVDNTLKVYDRLNQVRREIEQIKGRIQYLEKTSAMSVITVQLNSVATAKPVVRSGWEAIEQVKSAARAFVVAVQIIGTITIWLVIFSPVWASPLAVIHWQRRRKKSMANAAKTHDAGSAS